MTEQERQELREFYEKEYFIKTGRVLLCLDKSRTPEPKHHSLCREHIVNIAAEYWDVEREKILSKDKRVKIVKIRRYIMAVMRSYEMTHEDIGKTLGRDHSTSVYSIQIHENLSDTDRGYKEEYEKFREHCIAVINILQINKVPVQKKKQAKTVIV